jgi:Kef-type K+ transport system membrane component KefB
MSHGHGSVDYVRKFFVLFCLFASLLGLYHIAPNSEQGVGILALGFVILSAFLIGQVVEIIKLPHITGYLLAGVFLGPSLGETLHKIAPNIHLPPPFDHGILSFKVIENLGLLDTLALPLICITAGGALQPKEIKKALKPILGVLTGQVIAMFLGMMGLFYLMSGPISFLALPALNGLSLSAVLALGAVVAAVSIATSDAATIAIVVSTKSKGPMTTNIVSVAVLKDIVVVIAFAATTVIATSALGLDSGTSLGDSIFRIFLSAIFGVVLGYLIKIYMRYVNAELLLFVITLIYTVSFICDFFHLESALLFIAAGFIVANGPDKGGRFISEIEKLSTPVFVVFFTIAGAKLHLDVLVEMALFAFLLVAVRTLAFYIGCRTGAVLTNADSATSEYAWMGFVSQAGLAITLANSFIPVYGPELGGALFSFILGGVAIHEIIGPALLQSALHKAGELPSNEIEEESSEVNIEDATSNFTDSKLMAFSKKFQNILDVHIGQLEKTFDSRINVLRNEHYELHTLLESWEHSIIIQIDKEVESFPTNIYVELEDISFSQNTSDTVFHSFLRNIQRMRYKIRPWKREIDLRNLARYHIGGKFVGTLKDICIELSKLERSWALSYADGSFDIETVKKDKEIFLENTRRKFRILKNHFIQDMRLISTIDLRSWQRRTSLIFDERNETQVFLSQKCEALHTHVHILWKKVILQNMISSNLNSLIDQIKDRSISIPSISQVVDSSWQSDYEQLKQINSELSHIPNEIQQYIQLLFDDVPTTILYTPDSIDINIDTIELSNIQLQSNLVHLMEHSIEVELSSTYDIIKNQLSQYLNLYSEIIEIQNKELDDELHQSIERYRNRIVESHDKVQRSITDFLSTACSLLEEIIPKINIQFSSSPNKSHLFIETSNLWQKISAHFLQEAAQFQNRFHPIILPNYKQLINNQKLGYPKPFSQILLQESTEALLHSKDSLLFVGSPTQISQIILEISEELSNCFLSLNHTKTPRKGSYICQDISRLSPSEIYEMEQYILKNGRVIIGIPNYHWSYIQRKYSLHKIIKEIRILSPFSYKNIQEILLHRHNFSGYELNFTMNRKYFFDAILNISTQKRFFLWLHNESGGNIELAYEVWNRCIKNLEHDILTIDYGCTSNIIGQVSSENLLLIRQILRFSYVRVQDLEYWYGCSPREAEIKMVSLINESLLEIVPSNHDIYRIPLYKQPLLIKILETHGWRL